MISIFSFRHLLSATIAHRIRRDAPNILCLVRPGFDRDVNELQKAGTVLHFVAIPYLKLFFPIRRNRSFKHLQQRSFFIGENATRELFEPLTRVVSVVLRPWIETGQIVGFMSANYDYYQDEPFLQTAREFALPFFVLEKEHAYSPQKIQLWRQHLQRNTFPTRGHLGLLAGEGSLVHCEPFAGLEKKTSIITGLPRIDTIERLSGHSPLALSGLLLFEFGDRNLYPGEVFDETLLALIKEWSGKGPLIIQCQDAERQRVTRRRLESLGLSGLKGIEVRSRNLEHSLARSRWVVGANTMGLYEALFSRATVISLSSDSFSISDKTNIVSDSEGSMVAVSSPGELSNVIAQHRHLSGEAGGGSAERVAIREAAFHRPEGGSAAAVERAVLNELSL